MTSIGSSSTSEDGVYPAAIAAAYTNGLNAEPGWRCASRARLNVPRSYFRPPLIARRSPLRGSIATIAPCIGARRPVSDWIAAACRRTARSAESWAFRSSVVRTVSSMMSRVPPWIIESTFARTASSAYESFGSVGLNSSRAIRSRCDWRLGSLLAEMYPSFTISPSTRFRRAMARSG